MVIRNLNSPRLLGTSTAHGVRARSKKRAGSGFPFYSRTYMHASTPRLVTGVDSMDR
jgi:hypothetical protein